MKYSTYLIIWVAVISLLASCGVEVDKQSTPTLKAPKAEPAEVGDGFSLSSTDGTYSFFGSGLFIDPNAKVEDVQEVLKASVGSRIAKSKIVQIRNEILPSIQSKLNALNAGIADLENPIITPKLKAEFIDKSVSWYASYLELNDGELGKQKSKRFHDYCEALIWKFAFDKELIHANFEQLPIPSLACGSVYEKLGMFEEVCAPDSQNYFLCFWKNSVIKTKFFDALTTEQQSLISFLLESGELLEFVKKPLQRTKLASAFYSQSKMSTSLARKLSNKTHDKKKLKTLFLVSDPQDGYLTPKTIMEKVQFEDYLFIEDYPKDFKEEVLVHLELLAPLNDKHSLTDRFYNQPKEFQKETNQVAIKSTVFTYLDFQETDHTRLNTLLAQKLELNKQYQIASKTVEAIEDQLLRSLPASIEHMNKPGLANAFISLNIIYQVRSSQNQMEFSFSFDKNRFDNLSDLGEDFSYFKVCLSIEKTLQVPCKEEGGIQGAVVEFDPVLKELTITKDVLGNPSAWGLGPLGKADSKNGSFNELNQLKLERSKVVLKIAHGSLDNFKFTSGSILLYDNGNLWHEGSFSLMP